MQFVKHQIFSRYHNDKHLFHSNRQTTIHDFGYVSLIINGVTSHDSGNYTCRAINENGEATTTCDVSVLG